MILSNIPNKQIEALNKKHITTVEQFLRKPPLHIYDFSNVLPLSLDNEKTREFLEKNRPFAIAGKIKDFEIRSRFTHIGTKTITKPYIVIKVQDDNSNNTLTITSLLPESLKELLLNGEKNSPLYYSIEIPSSLPAILTPSDKYRINPACKEGIEYLNNNEFSAYQLLSLQTKGADGFSYDKYDEKKDVAFLELVKKYTYDPTRISSAYKWYKRGLRLDIAIKKALVEGYECIDSLLSRTKTFIIGGFFEYNDEYSMFTLTNPIIITSNTETNKEYYIQYSQLKGFTPNSYKLAINNLINTYSDNDFIPEYIRKDNELVSLSQSFKLTHFPKCYSDILKAKKRIEGERLLYFAGKARLNKTQTVTQGLKMTNKELLSQYVKSLPYELTNDQKSAINELYTKINSGTSSKCLLQGDVGTGKTAVAFCMALLCVASGYQVAIAAPYTTLAHQHYKDFLKIAESLNIKAALLTSDTKAREKRETLKSVEDGSIQVIIGTHSIFADAVKYNNLGLVIIDEEHKFGVVHKDSFKEKALVGHHEIIMSATPIPVSIAQTIYGDYIDIITINELPGNRIPIQTATCKTDKVILEFMEKQVKLGHQGYVICPSIDDNENSDIVSIEKKSVIYDEYFRTRGIRMAIITGKTSASEKESIMTDFAIGKIDILMATTVIEVGINVPNATVIAILNADRFGYATLHQLRGRVGRGSNKSYCILQSEEKCEKLEFLCNTLSGFEVAEKDLQERGPGEIFGTEQSGNNIYVDLILSKPEEYKLIKSKVATYDIEVLKSFISMYEEAFAIDD